MLLLIGSRALQAYGRLKDREPHDWDFITYGESYTKKIDGVLIEVSGTDKPFFETNKLILNVCKRDYSQLLEIETPIGKALVAPLPILKLLKLSCKDYLHKAKHSWDLLQLQDIKLPESHWDIALERTLDTKERVGIQKDLFFNKFKVHREIEHDLLHYLINPEPTFHKAQHNEVEMSEAKFMALYTADKVNIIREEAFVLALERYLLPKLKHYYVLKLMLYSKFNEFKTSQSVPYRTISKLCIPGLLKDHPEWIAEWAMQNNYSVMDNLDIWWHNQFTKIKPFLKEFIEHARSTRKEIDE